MEECIRERESKEMERGRIYDEIFIVGLDFCNGAFVGV